MGTFAVTVVPVLIEPHPNADALEIAQVGGYLSCVLKDTLKTGDLVAYIPEQALLPPELITEMGLDKLLAGDAQNRVHPIKLRGILSQGICYPARNGWVEGQDVTGELGIVKHVPVVPDELLGAVFPAGKDRTIGYDIENVKAHPDVFQDGEPVVFTEKLHGVYCQIGVLSDDLAHPEFGNVMVASKGLADQGLAFEPGEDNHYWRVERECRVSQRVLEARAGTGDGAIGTCERILRGLSHGEWPRLKGPPPSIFVMGEIFGVGIQRRLHYGASTAPGKLGFRVFDIYVGDPRSGHYLNDDVLSVMCDMLGLARVPVLYRGSFNREVMMEYTRGRETITGKQAHEREGIVMRPQVERRDYALGRVQLKSINPKYLLKTDGSELA